MTYLNDLNGLNCGQTNVNCGKLGFNLIYHNLRIYILASFVCFIAGTKRLWARIEFIWTYHGLTLKSSHRFFSLLLRHTTLMCTHRALHYTHTHTHARGCPPTHTHADAPTTLAPSPQQTRPSVSHKHSKLISTKY